LHGTDPIIDLKRALQRAIDLRFASLRAAAKKAGISADTASRATNTQKPVPTRETLKAILVACGNPPLNDRRYRDWSDLYVRAQGAERSRKHAKLDSRETTDLTRNRVIHEQYAARSIAPALLLDRDEELDILAAFIKDRAAGTYAWWQAEPWSGKSPYLN